MLLTIKPEILFASAIRAISLNCSSFKSGEILKKIGFLFILVIPAYYFLITVSIRRAHDINNS